MEFKNNLNVWILKNNRNYKIETESAIQIAEAWKHLKNLVYFELRLYGLQIKD